MKQYYQLLKSIFRNRLTLKKAFVPFLLLFFVSFSEVSYGWVWNFSNDNNPGVSNVSINKSTKEINISMIIYDDVSGTSDDNNLLDMSVYINGTVALNVKKWNTISSSASGYSYFHTGNSSDEEEEFGRKNYNYYTISQTISTSGTFKTANFKIKIPEIYAYKGQYAVEIRVYAFDNGSDGQTNNSFKTYNLVGWPSLNAPNLSATTDNCGYVNLTWTSSPQHYYQIGTDYQNNGNFSDWSLPTSLNYFTQEFKNSASNPNNERSYKLRVGYGSLMSGASEASEGIAVKGRVPEILDPPTNIEASQQNCDSTITLTWGWSGSNPEGFMVRFFNNNAWDSIDLSGSDRSYVFNHEEVGEILPNQDYSIEIASVNKCSILSTWETVLGKWLDSPNTPTNLQAKDTTLGNERAIYLSWNDNAINESRYVLKKTLFGGATSEYINLNENDTSYIDDNAAICNKYIYEVFAQNICTGLDEGNGVPIDQEIEKVLTFDLNTTFNPNDNSTAASTERFIGSKGYYPDRVEIKWSTANNLNLIEYFKVFRRQLGFNENYTQIASVTSSSQIYIDETTNAGTLYEYLIIGEAQCLTETVFTDSLVGIGFRSPTAIVNGQVNYSGGVAVENVKVLFETTTQSGKSIKLDGSSYLKVKNGFADSQNHNEFYLENWIYPINDSVFTIFEHGNFVFKYNNNQFEFSQNGIDSIFSAGQLSVGQWQHVGLALKDGLLYLFLNGEGQSYIKAPNSFLLSSSDSIKVGQGLIGNVEEIRFWESVAVDTNHIIDTIVTVNTNTNDTTFENSIKIVAPQITRDFSRYINGSETGLVTYLRLDEYAGRYSYDLSYSGLAYNRNNAEFVGSVTRENEKPTASQLSYAAYTNELGSYTATIPYTGVGQNFTVTPSYKTHEFNPATTALFLGDGSSVNNGVNFEDKSSFPVTGTLFYESTTCAVKEANILVDGESVVVNGHPVRTDVNGHFSVQVPIGHHIIEVSKQGHVFKEGRFPSSGTFDFQEPVNGIEFEDSTKVKVVGRVVGGLRDIAKLPNLGRQCH